MKILYIRPIKFGISGGTSAIVSILTFILCVEILHVWYLLASVISYIASFFVNFFLQKHWAFRDRDNKVHIQMGLFFANSVLNLVLNASLMFVLVDKVGIHHLPAYVFVLGLLAIMNYMLYKFVIFRNPGTSELTPTP